MNALVDRLFKLFEVFIVGCLAAMVVMVFCNAVLRKDQGATRGFLPRVVQR